MSSPDFSSQPELPPELVKFRTFGAVDRDGEDKQAVFELLRGRLRFSSFDQFNDPFECRPHFRPRFDDAGKQRDALLRYATGLLRKHQGLSGSEARRKVEAFMSGKTQAEVVKHFGEEINAGLAKGPPLVYCLSGPAALASPLPWSHYADSHRGICVHLDLREPPLKFAWPIRYTDDYPTLLVPRIGDRQWDEVQMQVLTKSKCWQYEDEYRLVLHEPSSASDPRVTTLLVRWDGPVALAQPTAVRAVTLGARMEKAARAELERWIAENVPHVELWEARLHEKRYELLREPLKRA